MGTDPDILVPLMSARSEFEASTIAESLRANGVPAEVFGTAAQMGQWEFGITNDAKIMVRRADLARAQDVLRAVKADSVDLDWSEVDVGAPADGSPDDEPQRNTPRARDRRHVVTAWIVVLALLLLALLLLPRLMPELYQSLPWRKP